MKNTFLILITIFISFISNAQLPNEITGINYQGIARYENGVAITDEQIDIEFTFISSTNSNLLTETHSGIQTNQFGLFTLIIGSINPGSLNNTIWTQANKIKVRADLGDGWQDIDEVSLTAVPYAFKAKYEGQRLNLESGWLSITDGNGLRLADSVQIGSGGGFSGDYNALSNLPPNFNDADSDPTNEIQAISISNDTIYLENGGFVKLPSSSSNNSDTDWLQIDGSTSTAINNDIYTDGKVGINTGVNTLSAQLEVKAISTNDAVNIHDGSNSFLTIKSSGNTGIGTNSPTGAILDVNGKIKMRTGAGAGLIPVSDANGVMNWANPGSVFSEVDGDINNEIQDLSITSNNLKITNNTSATAIDLSGYLDNTDNQNIDSITLNGNILTTYIQNGNNSSVNLSSIANVEDKDWLNSSGNAPSSNTENIYTMGKVGIGSQTNNSSTSNASLFITNQTSSTEYAATILNSTMNGKGLLIQNSFSTNNNFVLQAMGGNNKGLTVQGDGKIGIGTTTPTELLYLKSNDSDIDIETVDVLQSSSIHFKRAGGSISSPSIINNGQYFGNISFQGYNGSTYSTAARIEGSTDGTQSATQTNGKLAFHTTFGSTEYERMRITNDGNIGIGLTNPNYRLTVKSTSTLYASKIENTNTNGKGLIVRVPASSNNTVLEAGNGSEGLVLKGNGDTEFRLASGQTFKILGGNVGIGTNAPNEKLEVKGNIKIDNISSPFELNRTSTGSANLVPIAYGTIKGTSSPSVYSGSTGNISVQYNSTGSFRIFVAGEDLNDENYVYSVTAKTYSNNYFIANYDSPLPTGTSNYVNIKTSKITGTGIVPSNASFSIIIYKK